MKPYFIELEYPEVPELTAQLRALLIPEFETKKTFWNIYDHMSLYQKIPKFKEFITKHFGTIAKLYILVVQEPPKDKNVLDDNSIHKDTGTEMYRLNWPLQNGDTIETRFYSTNGNEKKLDLPSGQTYISFNVNDCKHEASLVLTKPTLFNVKEAHGLYQHKDAFPRILMSIKFENDISIDDF